MEAELELPETVAARFDGAEADFYLLEEVLENGRIKPVYQPIVSLSDGQIFGYEALSRIPDAQAGVSIADVFAIAEKADKTWELEKLCREKSMESAAGLDKGKKLFLNVDPYIIHDAHFRAGFTKQRLEEYGLSADNVIFEITERVAVTDYETFLGSIQHYKRQAYGIAIDDAGAGFSGFSVISDVKPDFIKLDINLVSDIDKDDVKRSLCKAMVGFWKSAGVKVIAEGIETAEELKTLIKLNVDLGQGFFLGTPKETFEGISARKAEFIARHGDNRRHIRKPIHGRRNTENVICSTDVKWMESDLAAAAG